MASMSTFGNTLTELQAGMNAAQGLEYQRSNFQDQIAAQRMADQLKARSDRDANLARIIESRNVRNQQGTQFDAELKNRLELGRLDAQSRKDVATIGAGRTDPRFADTIASIQAQNAKNLQDVNYAKKLSAARIALLAQKNAPMAAGEDTLGWNNPAYKKRVADTDASIKQLDAQAALLGLGLSADGGYVVPDFAEIPVPAMLNPNLPGAGGGYGARPSASSVSAFEPSLFSGSSFVLDPANPASPSRPAPAPFVAPAPQAPSYTYEVDLNGNFRAVPVPRPGDPRLRPAFGDLGIIP